MQGGGGQELCRGATEFRRGQYVQNVHWGGVSKEANILAGGGPPPVAMGLPTSPLDPALTTIIIPGHLE